MVCKRVSRCPKVFGSTRSSISVGPPQIQSIHTVQVIPPVMPLLSSPSVKDQADSHFVGYEAEGRISTGVSGKQYTPNFPKSDQGKKCLFFRKIWRALFS